MALPAESVHSIAGPAGRLQIKLQRPDGESRGHAVVCHPHPLHGGTQDNKVVYTLTRLLAAKGFATARFNFRGVGDSEGVFDHGIGETDDCRAVRQFLQTEMPLAADAPLWLAGFSFGAFVSARACEALGAACLISIAPAVTRFDFSTFARPSCPWFIAMGDADEVVEPQQVFAWAATLPPSVQMLRFDGAGHYFHGRLIELRERLEAVLPA